MTPNVAAPKATWMRFAVIGGIAIALFAYLGWQAGETTVSPGPPLPPAKWALPAPIREDPAKDLATVTARHPWRGLVPMAGAAKPGGKGPAKAHGSSGPPPWRLAGIVERPDGKFALIASGRPGAIKYEYRRIGDRLPDGSTLVAITADNAVARPAGASTEHRVYWLFRGKS